MRPPGRADVVVPLRATPTAEVRRMLRMHLSSLPDDVLERVELAATEVAQNALDTGAPRELRAWRRGERVTVEVEDAAPGEFAMPVTPGTTGGWGLRIVDGTVTRWGVRMLDQGKIVWFEIDV